SGRVRRRQRSGMRHRSPRWKERAAAMTSFWRPSLMASIGEASSSWGFMPIIQARAMWGFSQLAMKWKTWQAARRRFSESMRGVVDTRAISDDSLAEGVLEEAGHLGRGLLGHVAQGAGLGFRGGLSLSLHGLLVSPPAVGQQRRTQRAQGAKAVCAVRTGRSPRPPWGMPCSLVSGRLLRAAHHVNREETSTVRDVLVAPGRCRGAARKGRPICRALLNMRAPPVRCVVSLPVYGALTLCFCPFKTPLITTSGAAGRT